MQLTLVSAADAAYAHGLAAMLYSARAATRKSLHLDVRVIDGGLAAGDRERLTGTLDRAGGNARVTFVSAPALDGFAGGLAKHPLVYARLLVPDLFPDVTRALFLDADMLVRRDLSALLDLQFAAALAAAVPDTGNPTLDGPLERLPLEEFRLPPQATYYNVGMLWMNLDAWRRERLSERALNLCRERAHSLVFADQSALNVLVPPAWGWCPLDESWNRQVWIDEFRWQITPPGRAILHFTARKPWEFPLAGAIGVTRFYRACLRRGGWADYRPPVPTLTHARRPNLKHQVAVARRWCAEFRLALLHRLGRPLREAPWVRGAQNLPT